MGEPTGEPIGKRRYTGLPGKLKQESFSQWRCVYVLTENTAIFLAR